MPTNPYKCFYPDMPPVEVQAETTLEARDKALELFRRHAPRKRLKAYNITALRLDTTHDPAIL